MGLGARLRCPFLSACREKGLYNDLACACDGLFPLPVEEMGSRGLMAFTRGLEIVFSLTGRGKRPSQEGSGPKQVARVRPLCVARLCSAV